MKHYSLLLVALAASVATASAQALISPTPAPVTFLVADGSSSGTYAQFLKELSGATADTINFQEVKSSGAVENLDKLINNQCMAAFMHSDVLQFRAQSTDLSKFKTLLALFSEDVHFLALTQSKKTVGGNLVGWGKSALNLTSVEDLGHPGLKVGAAGGGYITAQVIRLQAQLPYDIEQYQSGSDVLNALASGEIDAAVFVGAAPLPNLANLGPEVKLLPMGSITVERLKSIYHPATITYTKMRPDPVSTVAADCLFVAREYKTPKFRSALAAFRASFLSHLDELKETPGNHPKWSEVDATNHGKWSWMELDAPKQ